MFLCLLLSSIIPNICSLVDCNYLDSYCFRLSSKCSSVSWFVILFHPGILFVFSLLLISIISSVVTVFICFWFCCGPLTSGVLRSVYFSNSRSSPQARIDCFYLCYVTVCAYVCLRSRKLYDF